MLYNSIKSLRRNRQKNKERRLVGNFDKKMTDGFTTLEKRLQGTLITYAIILNSVLIKGHSTGDSIV
jgi:hypothetical protein